MPCQHPILFSVDSGTYCQWCGHLLVANKIAGYDADASYKRLVDHDAFLDLSCHDDWWVFFLRETQTLTNNGWARVDAEREVYRRARHYITELHQARRV